MTIEITIKLSSWKDLPDKVIETMEEMVAFHRLGKALDEAAAGTEGADKTGTDDKAEAPHSQSAPHPTPLPAGGERERMEEVAPAPPPSPPAPHAEIIALLKADIETAEVTALLIVPLLDRWPEVKGDPKNVLAKTARKFSVYPKRELEFARDYLLKGNHSQFPDYQEVYGALGRYRAHKVKQSRDREIGETNGVRQ